MTQSFEIIVEKLILQESLTEMRAVIDTPIADTVMVSS